MHLRFEPLAGLPSLTDYELAPVDGAPGLYTLRSVDDPGIRLFLLEAREYLPDYHPALPPSARPQRVFVVATPAARATTVNLLAPIVVDDEAACGRQVVLDGDLANVRAPLAV